MRQLRAATLVVADPDATAALYSAWFGTRTIEAGGISAHLAASWGAPAMAGRRCCVCAPQSGAGVFLRFVQGAAPAGHAPLRSLGWAAIELCVRDVLAVHASLLGSPFAVIGPPARLDGLPSIFPMQVRGPDDEIVFLTQIDGDPPGQLLPRAACAVDCLFIVVLACSDLRASLDWFARRLQLSPGHEMALAYGVLSDAWGLPAGHKHRLATMTHGRDVFLELDQYPPEAARRPCHPGELPPGVAMATFASPAFAGLPGPWITPPACHTGAIYGDAPAATTAAPDGSLVEVVGLSWPGSGKMA